MGGTIWGSEGKSGIDQQFHCASLVFASYYHHYYSNLQLLLYFIFNYYTVLVSSYKFYFDSPPHPFSLLWGKRLGRMEELGALSELLNFQQRLNHIIII